MSKRTLRSDLLDQLNGLSLEKQRQVLEFARFLAVSQGKPGTEVLLFGGTIDPEDLSAMTQAIENGCEQVNTHEW